MPTTKEVPTPRKATTTARISKMPFDNIEVPPFWMMADETEVRIYEQRNGENPQQKIAIPRKVFDRFVDWYERGVIPPEEKRKPEW